MGKTTEFEFTARVAKEIRATGALVFIMKGNELQSGLPDRLVVSTVWSGFLEFKAAGGELRANQRVLATDCARRGFKVAVVSPDAVDERLAYVSPWPVDVSELPPHGVSMTPSPFSVASNGAAILEFLRRYYGD